MLVGVVLEKLLLKGMDETLLVLPLNITFTTIQSLITFGSSDFLAFIQSYFIGYAMSLFARNYQNGILDAFFEIVQVKIPKVLNDFSNWINNEVQEEVLDTKQVLFGTKEHNEDSESSDSKVMLSDENSMNEQLEEELSDKDQDQNYIY